MSDMSSILMMASSVCGAIVTILGAVSLIFKLPAKAVKKASQEYVQKMIDEKLVVITDVLKELKEDTKEQKEATKAGLRHDITTIHETYKNEKALPTNIKEDLCWLYSSYRDLGGNSYICELYEEMKDWSTK